MSEETTLSNPPPAVPLNEAKVEVETPSVSVSEIVEEEVEEKIATKSDVDGCRDAIQELTKILGEHIKENTKWFRAGKM